MRWATQTRHRFLRSRRAQVPVKRIAYIMAALPVAKAQSKKLIIATATVALQEQLIFKDLPEIKRHSGIDFPISLPRDAAAIFAYIARSTDSGLRRVTYVVDVPR